MWFTVKKINNFLYGIGEFKHFEEVISYLIVGKRKSLLIDTGLGIKNIKKVVKKITNNPISVINTHAHFDHIGGNKLFDNIIDANRTKKINLFPYVLDIIKTPGHSPDSICLYEKNKKWLFSGDTLYPAPIYLHLPESNISEYKNSLKKLNKYEILHIYPAHNDFNFPIKNIFKIIRLLSNKNLNKKIKVDRKTSLLIK